MYNLNKPDQRILTTKPKPSKAIKREAEREKKPKRKKKHTTVGIRWWSPTQLLIYRFEACVWQSGRDAQFPSIYGRMWPELTLFLFINRQKELRGLEGILFGG